ncbi:Pycsar system effector family protein [Streptomyces sp. NPDC060198]|uniref:Pycsar system effector family protein n=1 Tax=Streptomyces sp. NPDC060198 TaxID=3347070 RepID=UPI00365FE52B
MTDMTPLPPVPPLPPAPPAAPAPASAPLSVAGTGAGARLLLDLRAEISRADSKASVLAGALGMTTGVISGWLAGSGWRPAALDTFGAVLWWTGTAGLGTALLSMLLAVIPRYSASTWVLGAPMTYFGDIHRAASQNLLAEALVTTENASAEVLATSLTETSRIVVRKHRWIRVGLLAFAVGAALLPASLLLG